MRAVLDAIKSNPSLKPAMIKAAEEADAFARRRRCSSFGTTANNCLITGAPSPTKQRLEPTISPEQRRPSPTFWSTRRTRRNIFIRTWTSTGARLDGANRYTVTFPKGQTPPVNGFCRLTLYNEHHFFAPNEMKRYSLGTKNKKLQYQSRRLAHALRSGRPPATRNAATGCPRQRTPTFLSTSALTGRRLKLSTAHGHRRRC